MNVDKDMTDNQSTTGTSTCGLNCNADNLCCGLGLIRCNGSEIPPAQMNNADPGTEDQLLRSAGEGDEENQGMLVEPVSQELSLNEEQMPGGGQEPDEYEIVLNEEEETKPKTGLCGVFGSRKSKSSLASAATGESNELDLGENTKRGNVAVIETDDSLEAQTVDGDISIIDCNGNATRVTLMEKPTSRRRRRLYIMLALLGLALLCAVSALLVGLLKDRSKETSLESTVTDGLGENDGDITGDENDGDITGDENNGDIIGDGNNGDIIGDVIEAKSSLTSGCFQYTGEFLVCLSDEGADDGLCSVTVDGEACVSCTVCNAESGTVRVDCSNVVEDLAVINDECIDIADAFDGTLLEAFLIGNDGGFEGSVVDPAGQGQEDGNQDVGGGATDGEDTPDNVEDTPDVGDVLGPNYTTGCFDYNFRLNNGAVVCLFDEDPTDTVCNISVDGQDCDSCTVCDGDAGTGTVRADCTNLGYSPVINDACSSDNSVYRDTLLEAFMGDPEDTNSNDGGWVDASEVPEDVEVCVTMIESDYKCYARDTSVDVFFLSCEFDSDDWIGIFPATDEPQVVGTPANNLWLWACNGDIEDCEVATQSDIYTFDGLDAGSYRALLIRRNVTGPDDAYSWSDAFEVKDNAVDCELR
jgi:hypothetical protein